MVTRVQPRAVGGVEKCNRCIYCATSLSHGQASVDDLYCSPYCCHPAAARRWPLIVERTGRAL
eukprot:7631585-Pyramimonas_sp.AAC.1